MARRLAVHQAFLPIEGELRAAGCQWIAGLDEAGRGLLAGPVVAAVVVLPADCQISGLQDSKRLTARQREVVYSRIQQQAVAYGIGSVAHTQIDQHNILWATKEAMLRALGQLQRIPDMLLIDGITALPTTIAQRLIIGGDACCASIAAASVLAKVTRDRVMMAYAKAYPAYGFDKHKGYPTPEHYACLRMYGPCAIHRVSFRGVLPEAVCGGEGRMRSWRRWRGQHGEELAVQFLQRQGYRIQHQNYRCRGGEVDIIAWDGPTLVFIEVKTKGQTVFGAPQAMVDGRKQKKIVHVAMVYVQQHQLQGINIRFDVVAITLLPGMSPEVTHVLGAFTPSSHFLY